MNYRLDIQGLRAIAVLAVIIFHFNPAWLPGGFVGVDIFLVISGFLIGNILLSKKEKLEYSLPGTLKHFYVSRFNRIVPAYFSTLIVVSLVVSVLFLPADFSIYAESLKNAVRFNSNNYFAVFGDYFAPANYEQPLLHTWSLAIEIQFYLLAPFIFLLLPKQLLRWMLPVAVLLLTAYSEYRLLQGMHQSTYYSLQARLPAFLTGGWVAVLMSRVCDQRMNACRQKQWLSYIPVVLIAFAFVLPNPTGHFPGIAGLVPIAAAALFIWLNAKNKVTDFLSEKAMVFIGMASYSLYLWHWPVLAIIRYLTGKEKLDWIFVLAFIFLTLVCSVASYYFIETPLRKKSSKQQAIGYACLIFAAFGTAIGAKKLSEYFTPEPLPTEYTRYADPSIICHGKVVGECLKGDLSSVREVLVLGDSHAAMLNHFFDYLGRELGFKARIITASSCVTIPGFDYQRIDEWAQKPCLAQIKQAEKYLISAQTIFLAAAWHYQLPSAEFQSSLTDFLAKQSKVGSKIYILEQEPLLSKNPQRVLRFKHLGLDPIININPSYLQFNSSLRRLSAAYPDVTTLNFEETGVFAQAPFADGIPIYYDEHHLNEEGAKHYAAFVLSKFRKIMN